MTFTPEAEILPLLRVLLATVLGAAVGWEREKAERPAGLRTHMTVALAAALFTALGARIADTTATGDWIRTDPTRVLEAVVTGVSFLGAGTIFSTRRGETVKGLTTAASLLATAAVGVATALGSYVLAVGCTVLLLMVLGLVRRIEPAHAQDSPDGDRADPPRPGRAARAPDPDIGVSARRGRRRRVASRLLLSRRSHVATAKRRDEPMMAHELAGKWKQLKGEVRKRWGKLTDDDLDQVQGSWEKLVGRLQERYGHSREAADREARQFFDNLA
jgi:putative Mg2+ transporter-C (MgtC) family protein